MLELELELELLEYGGISRFVFALVAMPAMKILNPNTMKTMSAIGSRSRILEIIILSLV